MFLGKFNVASELYVGLEAGDDLWREVLGKTEIGKGLQRTMQATIVCDGTGHIEVLQMKIIFQLQ